MAEAIGFYLSSENVKVEVSHVKLSGPIDSEDHGSDESGALRASNPCLSFHLRNMLPARLGVVALPGAVLAYAFHTGGSEQCVACSCGEYMKPQHWPGRIENEYGIVSPDSGMRSIGRT